MEHKKKPLLARVGDSMENGRMRLKQSFSHHPVLAFTFKILVLTVAVVIILVGIAMLALPGPGLLVIFAGLALMATEVPWAHRQVRLIKLQTKRTWRLIKRSWKK